MLTFNAGARIKVKIIPFWEVDVWKYDVEADFQTKKVFYDANYEQSNYRVFFTYIVQNTHLIIFDKTLIENDSNTWSACFCKPVIIGLN